LSYKSQFERKVAQAFKENGIKFEYEPMVVDFTQPEKKRKYTPDFRIKTKKGTLVVETKGRLTREERQKLIWIRDSNPKLKIILMFMNSSVPIQKGSPTSYGDWAKKNGFEYHDFRFGLPKDWQ
jgi:predicted nuclease of restriction endonuclease-like RecB superfamily